MNYKHITIEERACIETWLKDGITQTEIAKRLNRNKGTISREVKRCKNSYNAIKAHKDSKFKRLECHRKIVIDFDEIKYIKERLEIKWSPEQIIGEYKTKYKNAFKSISTIYRYINKGLFNFKKSDLRHGESKKKNPKGKTRYKNSKRVSDLVRDYFEFGHWEADTIVGKDHSSYILTVCEKLTGLTYMKKLFDQTADEVANILSEFFKENKALSLTVDNGWEFATWENIEKECGVPVYFARPGCPWEKPTIEYTNKLIRQYFPKGSNLAKHDSQKIDYVTTLLNNRPRKKLGFQKPRLLFQQLKNSI